MKKQTVFLFSALCLAHFYIDAMFGIWPIWKTLAHYDIALAGLITGIAVFCGEGMQTFFGNLSDKGWTKKLIFLGLFISSCSLLYPLSSFPMACCLLFMTCLSSASFHPSAVAAVAHLPLYSITSLMACFQAFGFLGVALGQKLFISLFSWNSSAIYLFLAIPALLFYFLRKAPLSHLETCKESLPLLKTLSLFWKNSILQKLYLLLVMNQAAFWSLLFLLPEVAKEKGLGEWFTMGGGTFLFVLGAACTCVPLGLLANRLHIVQLLPYLALAATALMGLFLTSTSFFDPLILFALGGVIGAATPLALALGAQVEPKRRGLVSAYLMGGVWILSETMGYALSGLLFSCLPVPQATHTLQFFALCLVVGLVLSLQLKRHFYKAHAALE